MKVRVGSHTCAHTCLKRDGTLQPQACMMPSSRRMCSRTCRYCSRRCSRRAITAESLRRDATPLLASLRTARGGGQGETERSVSSLASQQQEDEKVKGREEGECSSVTHLTKLYRSWSKTASFGAQTLRGVKNIECLWLQILRK